jgi:hypothetical protein
MINITYIYLITGIDNSPYKVYIGKTKNFQNRKNNHRTTYGFNIECNVIDEVHSLNRKDWEPLESYWIQQFKAWGFTIMNKNKGGGGIEYRTKDIADKIIPQLHKPIIQYDINCNFIRKWESIIIAKKQTNIKGIPNCLRKTNKTAGGYIWKYEGDTDFTYNISTHKSKNQSKPEGFGKKPKGFGDKVSKSLLRFYMNY